jgi:hypothetical protein
LYRRLLRGRGLLLTGNAELYDRKNGPLHPANPGEDGALGSLFLSFRPESSGDDRQTVETDDAVQEAAATPGPNLL